MGELKHLTCLETTIRYNTTKKNNNNLFLHTLALPSSLHVLPHLSSKFVSGDLSFLAEAEAEVEVEAEAEEELEQLQSRQWVGGGGRGKQADAGLRCPCFGKWSSVLTQGPESERENQMSLYLQVAGTQLFHIMVVAMVTSTGPTSLFSSSAMYIFFVLIADYGACNIKFLLGEIEIRVGSKYACKYIDLI